MVNDFSVSKLKTDIATIQAAGTTFKIDVSRKFYKNARIYTEVPVTYRLVLSKMLKYWHDIATETELTMRSSKGIVGAKIIPYSDVKQYVHAQNDYASVVLFLDGLIRGLNEGAIAKDSDVTFFYNDVIHHAFIGGPRSVGGILEEISEIDADKVDADEADVMQYDSMRQYNYFHPNDFMEIRKSFAYVINFVASSDIYDVHALRKKPLLMSICLSKLVDYITYTAAMFAARICAIRSYADPFLPASEETVTEMVESPSLQYPFHDGFEGFELTRAASTLDNSDDFLNMMYDVICINNGSKLFPKNEVPTDYYAAKQLDIWKGESRICHKLAYGLTFSKFISDGCTIIRDPRERQFTAKPFKDTPFDIVERVKILRHLDQNGNREGHDRTLREDRHFGRSLLISMINELIIPENAGDAMRTLVQLYGFSMIFINGLETFVERCEDNIKPLDVNIKFGSTEDHRATASEEGIKLCNEIYTDVITAVGEQIKKIVTVFHVDRERRDSTVKGMFDLHTGIDIGGTNSDINVSLRDRYIKDRAFTGNMSVEEARKEVYRSDERDNFLEVYAQPFYDEMTLYDEYLTTLPRFHNHPFYEADGKSKSFKDTIADAFNALMAMIRGLWEKITEFFKNAKFIRAAAWVNKHKDELLKMNFAAVEIKVVNYKKDINLPTGFDNIFKNMTNVPATAPEGNPDEVSKNWVKNLYPSDTVWNWFATNAETGKIKYKNLIMFAENEQAADVDTSLEKEDTVTGQTINQLMVTWIENVTNHEGLYKKWESINKSVETAINTLKTTTTNKVSQLQNTAPVQPAQPAQGTEGQTQSINSSASPSLKGRPYFEEGDDGNSSEKTDEQSGDNKTEEEPHTENTKEAEKFMNAWNNFRDKYVNNGEVKYTPDQKDAFDKDNKEIQAMWTHIKSLGATDKLDVKRDFIESILQSAKTSQPSGDSEVAPANPTDKGTAETQAQEQQGENQGGTPAGQSTEEQKSDKEKTANEKAIEFYNSLPIRAQKAMLNLYTPVASWICDMISDQYKYIQKAYNKAKGIADKKEENNKVDQQQIAQDVQASGV